MEVEHRLPRARPDVDDHAVVVEPLGVRRPRPRSAASGRPPRPGTRRSRGTCRRAARAGRAGASRRQGRCRGSRRSRRRRARDRRPATRRQKRQSVAATTASTPSSATPTARARTSVADRRVDEPRRVVVGVAAARAVDEDDVLAPDPARPASPARAVGRRPQARAALLLDLPRARDRRAAVRVPGRGEYGKTCTFVIPTSSTARQRVRERAPRPRSGSRRSRRS